MPKGLALRLIDYPELVDWTGRAILERKRGKIPDIQPPMLERLQIDRSAGARGELTQEPILSAAKVFAPFTMRIKICM
jgi:hypothetical protein